MKAVASVRIKPLQDEIQLEEITAQPKNGFKYEGVDSLGVMTKGTVPFISAEDARFRLTISGISVVKLTPISSMFKRKRDKRPSLIEMAQLAEQLAAQKEITTYDRACRIIARVHPNLAMQKALEDVADRILFGQPPDQAFDAILDKKGKPFFPITFINAFRIGDEVGAAPDPETDESVDASVAMLRHFAQAQRKADEILKKIKSAMMYPAGIFTAVIVAFFVEVYWIVPIFAQIFIGLLQGKDTSLPLPTQFMLDVSDFFRSPLGWGTSLLLFASAAASVYYFFFHPKGIDTRERLLLKTPLLKKFFLPYYGSIFCRNLSMLWASGGNMIARFQTVAETSTNPVFREMSLHFANQVTRGTETGQLFNGYYHLLGEVFAPVAETLESASDGEKHLYSYAKYLEQQAEENLAIAITVLNQAAFFISAGMVIFILLASYMPLIEMVGRLAGK